MALMKRPTSGWNPMTELEEMSTRLNQLFDRFALGGNGHREALRQQMEWAPSANISETDDAYRVMAELPGVEKKNVHVALEEGTLTISGEREQREEKKGEKFHRVESYYGTFMRRFAMPEDADENAIDASFDNGMLTVTIRKSPEKKKPRAKEIAIK